MGYKKVIILRGYHLKILHSYLKYNGNESGIQMKDEKVIKTAVEDGYSKKMGMNIVSVMKEAMQSDVKIKLTDTLDDICVLCNKKNTKECKEFIPYGISVAAYDGVVLHNYGLQKRTYKSSTIKEKLRAK